MSRGFDEPGLETIQAGPCPLSSICPGDKAALFYPRQEEMRSTAISLIREGLDQGEICVLMARSSYEETKSWLGSVGLDVSTMPNIAIVPFEQVRMEEYSSRSISEQMVGLVHQAQAQGYSGARLILDVPEALAIQVPEEETWTELDRIREELGITVVCMYDLTTLSPELLIRSLTSYPMVIMQGMLCQNYYYIPRMEGGSPDPRHDLYHQLNTIRTENIQRSIADQERSQLIVMNDQLQEEMDRRKVVEFALLQAENNQRMMLDAMTDMVFMVDRELKVTQGNRAFLNFLESGGLDTAYEGKTIFELFPGLPNENHFLYEEIFQYGRITVAEESIHLESGRLEVEVRRVPVFKGKAVDRIVVIFRLKPAIEFSQPGMWEFAELLKRSLSEPEGPLQKIMEKCPHPILVQDVKGKVLQFNRTACDELGYSEQELMALDTDQAMTVSSIEKDGCHRRYNFNGRISMPVIVHRKNGTAFEAMSYLSFVGQGKERRTISVIKPH